MQDLKAFLFGFTVAIAIGPIAVLIIHNGLNHGLGVAARSGLGAAFADFTYSLVALTAGAAAAVTLHGHEDWFRGTTSLVLLAIGLWMAHRPLGPSGAAGTRKSGYGFWITYVLTMFNPLTVLIFLGFAGQLELEGKWSTVLRLAVLIFLGSLAVQSALALFGAGLRRWVENPRVIRILNAGSGVVIALFGIWGLLRVALR